MSSSNVIPTSPLGDKRGFLEPCVLASRGRLWAVPAVVPWFWSRTKGPVDIFPTGIRQDSQAGSSTISIEQNGRFLRSGSGQPWK
jgi:hypothetical protein